MKTISYDNYLRLVGLLALAAEHNRTLADIERSACALTGEPTGGHTSDAIWSGDTPSAAQLLAKLGYELPTPDA